MYHLTEAAKQQVRCLDTTTKNMVNQMLRAANSRQPASGRVVEHLNDRAAYVMVAHGQPVAIRLGKLKANDTSKTHPAVTSLRDLKRLVGEWDIELLLEASS